MTNMWRFMTMVASFSLKGETQWRRYYHNRRKKRLKFSHKLYIIKLYIFYWVAYFTLEERSMSTKTDTEVIIAGKVFTLSGYESEEYLQKVASYINNKVAEYNKVDSFKRQSIDTQNVLLQLNIADDYFKAKNQISRLEEEIQNKEKELYDLKHELIASQIKLENVEKTVQALQFEAGEDAKKIVRMEKELKDLKI